MPVKCKNKKTHRQAFNQHVNGAKGRGIPFRFTFEQWLQVWTESGHFHERGSRRGQYVMARFGDEGAYEPGNVKIITSTRNIREARFAHFFKPGYLPPATVQPQQEEKVDLAEFPMLQWLDDRIEYRAAHHVMRIGGLS